MQIWLNVSSQKIIVILQLSNRVESAQIPTCNKLKDFLLLFFHSCKINFSKEGRKFNFL